MESTYRLLYPGEKFNRLTVVEFHHLDKRWRKHYRCICDCGIEKIVQGSLLVTGNTKSCGCYGRETRKLRNLLPNNGGVINHLVLQYKRHARDRNIEYDLDRDVFEQLIRSNCYYCNAPPSNTVVTKNCKSGFAYNGIDRKESCLGYSRDNCVAACCICNRVKRDRSEQEFLNWANRICEVSKARERSNL